VTTDFPHPPFTRYNPFTNQPTNNQTKPNKTMAIQAIGILETRGLAGLVNGTDAMLKAANVTLAGPMRQIGSAMCNVVIEGDVAAVKAAVDAGASAAEQIGEVLSAHVIARPDASTSQVLPKRTAAAKK
jgi:ethanolamine utilization protein EutM